VPFKKDTGLTIAEIKKKSTAAFLSGNSIFVVRRKEMVKANYVGNFDCEKNTPIAALPILGPYTRRQQLVIERQSISSEYRRGYKFLNRMPLWWDSSSNHTLSIR